jgi:predicted transcriptional regulator
MVRDIKSHALTIRFSEADAGILRELSEREDISAATVVRRALREYAQRLTAKPAKRAK